MRSPYSPYTQQNPFLWFCTIRQFGHLAKFCLDTGQKSALYFQEAGGYTRVNQLLSFNIMFFRLLNLLFDLQNLEKGRTILVWTMNRRMWLRLTVALGSTSIVNFFCWRSLNVINMVMFDEYIDVKRVETMVKAKWTEGRGGGGRQSAGEFVDDGEVIDVGKRVLWRRDA